jgi:hypothetical protein
MNDGKTIVNNQQTVTAPSYQQEISRKNTGCVVFVLDQSGSMHDASGGSGPPKSQILMRAVNRFIRELTLECLKGEDKPRHFFDVGLIGYCTDEEGRPLVGPAFQGALAGRDLVSVVDLFDNPLRVEVKEVDDGDGGLLKKKSYVWYDPAAQFGTPTMTALDYTKRVVAGWIAAHPKSFPPIVLHITDGDPTDGDPEPAAAALRDLSTDDGNVLLFNCHLSERTDPALLFPAFEFDIPGTDSMRLFRMSSLLPEKCLGNARAKGYQVEGGARGMIFNADSTHLIQLIQIGTRVARVDLR